MKKSRDIPIKSCFMRLLDPIRTLGWERNERDGRRWKRQERDKKRIMGREWKEKERDEMDWEEQEGMDGSGTCEKEM